MGYIIKHSQRDFRSRHCFQQAWPKTISCSTGWESGSLLGLTDTAAAFPLAGPSSRKAEHVSQKNTHRNTHTEDTDTASYTERVLPSTTPSYRIDTISKPRKPYLLILLGWQRQEVTHAGTHTTLSCPTSHQLAGSAQCFVQTNTDDCQALHHRIIES